VGSAVTSGQVELGLLLAGAGVGVARSALQLEHQPAEQDAK
jgi:ribose 5-phosphate isomerase RpiB